MSAVQCGMPDQDSRRRLLAWSALALAAGWTGFPREAAALVPARARTVAARSVRLLPSVFADSVAATRRYLMGLEADRLLHNFHAQAGLAPKGEAYAGWEGDTIAGHTLGHYLSALALMHAGNGDSDCKLRAGYIVAELRACQLGGGDGYVAGLTRRRADGTIEGGRVVFDEISRGEIRARPFDLNGSWSPFYTLHKLFAGLLEAHRCCGNPAALAIALDLAAYVERTLAPLSEAQMQQVLECEFGGLPESLAELSSCSGDARWLRLAGRFRHARVLDPLAAGQDRLSRLHANTQIPKLLGAARQFELSGRQEDAAAALFFWRQVVQHHSYAIGGNSDREYFQSPDTISRYLTEQTCEHCNTLNMMRLSRYLHAWSGSAEYLDYYERALYNHVLSQQHPEGSRYSYMTPMQTGESRRYSDPEADFWCCVGTGMESHAQFSDTIYWSGDDGLSVNLYIPSILDDPAHGLSLHLESSLPHAGRTSLHILSAAQDAPRRIRLRMPSWTGAARIAVNSTVVPARPHDGYVVIERRWRAGDRIDADFPMPLRMEPCADDPAVVSLRRGPCVLAADLGPDDSPWDGVEPWLEVGTAVSAFAPMPEAGRLHAHLPSHPHGLEFAPFHALHERRYAVYFRHFDAAARRRWEAGQAELRAHSEALLRETLDSVALGDGTSEKAHDLATSGASYAVHYRRTHGRDARSGGAFEFTLRGVQPARALRLRYWGQEHGRRFTIRVQGEAIAHEVLDGGRGDDFISVDHPLPAGLRPSPAGGWRVRIEPDDGYSAGPVFGVWLLAAASS